MSDKIKYGETYESLASKILPLFSKIDAEEKGESKLKYGDTYTNVARNVKAFVGEIPVNMQVYPAESYPPWWNTTITLYNHYIDNTTQLTTWYRTVIRNCFFQNEYDITVGGQTIGRSNSTVVRIPENYIYKDYAQWATDGKDKLSNYFTLQQGDIIIRGEVDDVIDETKRGMFSSDIAEKYKRLGLCTLVQAYQNNTGGGRGTPHYKVIGD